MTEVTPDTLMNIKELMSCFIWAASRNLIYWIYSRDAHTWKEIRFNKTLLFLFGSNYLSFVVYSTVKFLISKITNFRQLPKRKPVSWSNHFLIYEKVITSLEFQLVHWGHCVWFFNFPLRSLILYSFFSSFPNSDSHFSSKYMPYILPRKTGILQLTIYMKLLKYLVIINFHLRLSFNLEASRPKLRD